MFTCWGASRVRLAVVVFDTREQGFCAPCSIACGAGPWTHANIPGAGWHEVGGRPLQLQYPRGLSCCQGGGHAQGVPDMF